MGIFKKEGVDIMDFTLLKKKGILKIKDDIPPDVIDFRKLGNMTSMPMQPAQETGTNLVPSLDFLNNLADSASTTNTVTNPIGNLEMSNLAVKVDNLEYKLERLLEKFSAIESKVDELTRVR